MTTRLALLLLSLPALAACAPPPPAKTAPPAAPPPSPPPTAERRAPDVRREADEYTLYELLDPDSAQFHILFEVTAITPGATAYFNPIRKGSEASGESVRDRATSQPLPFEVVSGEEARTSGLPEAELTMNYIRVHLPHPVPPEGGIRLLIEKTYKDPKSYAREGADRIVFSRTLGIRRNAIVLPAGYELIACNYPSQIVTGANGRIEVSFMHPGPEAVPLVLKARRLGK
ncbi:MAG: hypothetical protein JF614_31865 [Acidobacteria bacterium]|nr:hypothetical protein [Acidobacteriota bacterium]